jgi:nucleoside-diphosphate kinase
MGAPKHLIEIDRYEGGGTARRTLLGHALATALAAPHAGVTCVLAGGDARGAEIARSLGAAVVIAHPAGEGRAASVRAGVRAAPGAAAWLFLPADQPFLTAGDLASLVTAWAGRDDRIVHASYAGARGTPVLFGAAYRDELLALYGTDGGRVILARHPDTAVAVPLPPAHGRDLDRPDDLPPDASFPVEMRAATGPTDAPGAAARGGGASEGGARPVDLPRDRGRMPRTMERTLSIIKPDAVRTQKTGAILQSIEDTGLRVVALRMLKLRREQAEQFYAVHHERPFYASLCAFMTSGPIVVSALEGDDAIARYRKLMGDTNPAKAAEGTLRKRFATDIEQNAVHGSDGPDTAKGELSFFFPEL